MDLFNIICLFVTLVLCVICLVRTQKHEVRNLLLVDCVHNEKVYNVLLFIVAVIALGIRIYKFGILPGGVWCDGAMAAVDAKAIAEYGTDRFGMKYPVHLTAWGFGQMSSLLSYLMVPFIKIFGFSTTVIRLPTLIMSMIGMLCLYLFVRSAFNRNLALIVLAFAAINPWHFMQSRWALDCNLYSHFFMIGTYLLHKGIKEKKLYIFLSMVGFGLCMYCYGISIYTMPFFLIAACVYLLKTKKVSILDALLCVVIYLLVAWPFIAVMVINFFKLNTIETPWFTIPYFPDSIRSNDILFFSENWVFQFIINCICFCLSFFNIVDDVAFNVVPGFGTMYVCSVPFIVLGAIEIWKSRKNNPGAIIFLFYFMTGVLAGLFTNYAGVWRLNIVFYPMMIMAGAGIYNVVVKMKKGRYFLVPIYLLSAILFFGTYFTTHSTVIERINYKGLCDALVAVQDDDIDKYYITNHTLADDGHVLFDRSEIIAMYYHEVDSQEYYGIGTYDGCEPGKNKYVHDFFKEKVVPTDENAVYIFHEDEIEFFDEETFIIEQFDNFYTAIPKK